MTIVEDKMIELGLRYIKYTGNHPLQPGYTRKLLWSLWVPGAIYGFVLTFIGFCKLDGDIEVLASKAEGFLAQFQSLIRFSTLLLGRNTLRTLLEKRKKFWKITSVDKVVEERIKRTVSIGMMYFRIFTVFVSSLTTLFICLPAFEGKYNLPLSTWVPEEYAGVYEVTYVIQAYMSVQCAWVVIGFDVVFAAICIELTMQFQLLNRRLLSLASLPVQNVTQRKKRLELLNNCVEYHSFLIIYSSHVISFYEYILLLQYGIAVGTSCMELYMVSTIQRIGKMIECALFIMCLLFQVGFQCFLAEELSSESLAIGDAMFYSGWYLHHMPEEKVYVTFLITRSQQAVYLKGGKVLLFNRELFASIIRKAVSFYMILRTLQD